MMSYGIIWQPKTIQIYCLDWEVVYIPVSVLRVSMCSMHPMVSEQWAQTLSFPIPHHPPPFLANTAASFPSLQVPSLGKTFFLVFSKGGNRSKGNKVAAYEATLALPLTRPDLPKSQCKIGLIKILHVHVPEHCRFPLVVSTRGEFC